MMTSTSIADLITVLALKSGHNLTFIEQIDFVECEDERHTMAYVHFIRGDDDDCVTACFVRPPLFDPDEVRMLLFSGNPAARHLH
jgi:hypothetical protein